MQLLIKYVPIELFMHLFVALITTNQISLCLVTTSQLFNNDFYNSATICLSMRISAPMLLVNESECTWYCLSSNNWSIVQFRSIQK